MEPLPSLLAIPRCARLESTESHVLVLTGGRVTDAFRRVVLLPFAPGARAPQVVLKLWRSPARNLDTFEEQRILEQIRSVGPSGAPGSVPEPLGSFRWGTLRVAVESYCPGRSFAARHPRRSAEEDRKLDDLRSVLFGLALFSGHAVIERKLWSAGDMGGRAEQALRTYEEEFTPAPEQEKLFEAVRGRSESLSRISSGRVVSSRPGAEQRADSSRGSRSSTGPGLAGWPRDILYFLLVAGFDISGARNEERGSRSFADCSSRRTRAIVWRLRRKV
jgi:hypothetical protein